MSALNPTDIINGLESSDSSSNINHPFIKFLFVLFFFIATLQLMIFRTLIEGQSINIVWAIFWIIITIRGLDLRPTKFSDNIAKGVLYLFIGFAPFFWGSTGLVNITASIRLLEWLGKFVSIQDILLFIYTIGFVACICKIYYMDVLWIVQKFPNFMRDFSIVVFVAYFVIRRFISMIINESIKAASFKVKIIRTNSDTNSILVFFSVFIRALATQMILKFSDVVAVTQALLRERGISDVKGTTKIINIKNTIEDYIALSTIILSSIVFTYIVAI